MAYFRLVSDCIRKYMILHGINAIFRYSLEFESFQAKIDTWLLVNIHANK